MARLLFESGDYFVQHFRRCGDYSRVASDRANMVPGLKLKGSHYLLTSRGLMRHSSNTMQLSCIPVSHHIVSPVESCLGDINYVSRGMPSINMSVLFVAQGYYSNVKSESNNQLTCQSQHKVSLYKNKLANKFSVWQHKNHQISRSRYLSNSISTITLSKSSINSLHYVFFRIVQ